MSDWYRTLEGLWDKAWTLLETEGAPRYIALATTGAEGPANRLVVVRRADRAAGTVTIYTDVNSVKVAELRADPRAALAYWRSADLIQIRLEGEVTVTTGEAAASDWEALSARQRGDYGVTPAPASAIAHSEAYTRPRDKGAFARLDFTAGAIDIVHLSPDHHRRALYARETDWQGQWRAP